MTQEKRSQIRKFRSYATVGVFVLLTLAMAFGHGSSVLNFAFPVLATILAAVLYQYRRSTYVAFTWWIWCMTPFVRRLVDYHTYFHSFSPVMLTPLAVTGFAFLAIVRRPRVLLRRSMLPFALFGLVTFLAFVVGSLLNSPFSSAYEWSDWLLPLSFGIFLAMDVRGAEENREAFVNAIVVGAIFVGAYGIYQFFQFPAWDAFWLNNTKLTSAGSAFAEQVRVFGPLNDPGTYAFVLVISLVFVLVAKGPLRLVAGAVCFPALLLSEERAAWGVWILATLFVFWRMSGKLRLRLALVSLIIAAFALPILTVGPVAQLVTKRFSSIAGVQSDNSALSRESLYGSETGSALAVPIGQGFGATGVSAKLTTGQNLDFDSGLLSIPLTFGWVGGLIIMWSIFRLVIGLRQVYLNTKDQFTIAACGLFLAMIPALIFGQVFAGPLGMVVWSAVGFALSTPVSRANVASRRVIAR